MKKTEQLIIAGPCALESLEHAKITISNAKNLGITHVRANLRKPRTEPGFDGVGKIGIPWLQEIASQDLVPSLEVLHAREVDMLMEEILGKVPHSALLVWLGSRNQNHDIQQEIGKAVAGESRIKVMIKNQPWRDEAHWRGIAKHLATGGADKSQLLMCHRGFAPWDKSETNMRNIPDLDMALKVKIETGLPMILDPSHIGGQRGIVVGLIGQFLELPWVDGQIIEVHPNPDQARTDAKQQLTWEILADTLGRQR